MINPNELRIGNYVAVDNYCYKIETITKNGSLLSDLNTNLNEGICEHKLIEPIELTEEWLIKAGFYKWGRNDMPSTISFEKNILHIATNQYFEEGITYGWMWDKQNENDIKSWAPKVKIKYVHQLQNIYFALTCEELTFNL